MKQNKLFICTLGVSVLLVSGCVEERFEVDNKRPVLAENEIIFGATASFANDDKDTKTEYGDINTDNYGTGHIEVNWVNGDNIYIGSPQTLGTNVARYMVEGGGNTDGYHSDSKVSSLVRIGDVGLQWNPDISDNKYTFYGMYPTVNDFTDSDVDSDGDMVSNNISFSVESNKATMTGYLPMLQKPKEQPTLENGGYTIEPDMRYAYMVARNEYTRTGEENNVSLSFKSLVTALQFKFIADKIDYTNTIGGANAKHSSIFVNSVSVYSDDNKIICGAFEHDFDGNTESKEKTGFNRVTMNFDTPLEMSQGQYCDFTFFLLPTASFSGAAESDLKVTIFFTLAGVQYQRTATIGQEIQAQWKYYFKDVKLPPLTSESIEGSNWVSGVEDAVYISELSIPVAGNAFSYLYEYEGNDASQAERYYKQQIRSYTELWQMGVRGFEFKTSYGGEQTGTSWGRPTYKYDGTVAYEHFVCNGMEMDGEGTVTFENAFETLATMMDSEQYAKEFMIVIATYQSHGDNDVPYDPAAYVKDLEAFLTGNNTKRKDYTSKLAKLTNTSTVADLRGKIAVVVRIGDDDYCKLISQPTTSELSATLPISVINNWGTSVDQWDKRYDSNYYTQGAYAISGSNKLVYEDNLVGISKSNSGWEPHTYDNTTYDFGLQLPTKVTRSYTYAVNTTAGRAHVQSWERVIPNSFTNAIYSGESDSVEGSYYYLWYKWPSSVDEKKEMIKETFEASMTPIVEGSSTTKADIYLNSVCGFFPVQGNDLPQSWYPQHGPISAEVAFHEDSGGWFDSDHPASAEFSASSDSGKGGDWASCSAELNKYTYDYLSNLKTQGPYGLVMINYIGATATEFGTLVNTLVSAADAATASLALPNMIMMNNFMFPLETKPTDPIVPAIAKSTASVKSWADEDCNGDRTEASIVWE